MGRQAGVDRGRLARRGEAWSTGSDPMVAKAYDRVAGRRRRSPLTYDAPWRADGLAAALAAARADDVRRGVTTVGPHRDDLVLSIAGLPARTHASQGEQRSLALALRLGAHELVTEFASSAPILLLDDVFSELDPDRAATPCSRPCRPARRCSRPPACFPRGRRRGDGSCRVRDGRLGGGVRMTPVGPARRTRALCDQCRGLPRPSGPASSNPSPAGHQASPPGGERCSGPLLERWPELVGDNLASLAAMPAGRLAGPRRRSSSRSTTRPGRASCAGSRPTCWAV